MDYGTLTDRDDSRLEAKTSGNLARRLKVLTHPAQLVLDEIGCLPVTNDGAILFLQLIYARHERSSTVLTSNKGFDVWGGVLDNDSAHRPAAAPLSHREHSRQPSPDAGAPGPAVRDRPGPKPTPLPA